MSYCCLCFVGSTSSSLDSKEEDKDDNANNKVGEVKKVKLLDVRGITLFFCRHRKNHDDLSYFPPSYHHEEMRRISESIIEIKTIQMIEVMNYIYSLSSHSQSNLHYLLFFFPMALNVFLSCSICVKSLPNYSWIVGALEYKKLAVKVIVLTSCEICLNFLGFPDDIWHNHYRIRLSFSFETISPYDLHLN